MPILVGDKLPEAILRRSGLLGPEETSISSLTAGRKVVIFGLPGAYTSTCSASHVPSFMRTKDQFASKGVAEIICVSVNDVFVMKEWGESTGARAAGISMWADPVSEFTKAIGKNFSAPIVGFVERSSRYAMLVENGTVTILNEEVATGVCDLTAGEGLLDAMMEHN